MAIARKDKTGYEVLCEAAFRPLAHLVVLALAPLRVPPPAVVLTNAAFGFAGAVAIARGNYVAAAVLLQVKTVLDNADGQLARATGRISALGRYLDSECDLLTNAAIFVALGYATGHPWLAAGAFVALTLSLSVNFNLERLSKGGSAMPAEEGFLAGVYRVLYAPQDRLCERLLPRNAGRRTLSLVAQLGLSTQLAVLGLCLVLGRPELFLWFCIACFAALVPLVVRRRAGTANLRSAL